MSNKSSTSIVHIALFAVLTAVGAMVIIPVPYSPVPITLQTLFCVMAGALLGKYKGFMSQIAYISLGIAGLPVFSGGGSGIAYITGPTGGYLWGFVLGSFICGFLVERKHIFFGMAAGMFIIYLPGIVQLRYVTGMNWSSAVFAGVLPFIPGDILKLSVGYAVYKKLNKTGILQLIK